MVKVRVLCDFLMPRSYCRLFDVLPELEVFMKTLFTVLKLTQNQVVFLLNRLVLL